MHALWFFSLFQGVVLSPDAGRGVIVSNRSLVLQRVGRFRAGGYRCAARNSEGHAESNAVDLRIKCKIVDGCVEDFNPCFALKMT